MRRREKPRTVAGLEVCVEERCEYISDPVYLINEVQFEYVPEQVAKGLRALNDSLTGSSLSSSLVDAVPAARTRSHHSRASGVKKAAS